MPFDPERYTHDADRAALKTLKAIPGFSALTKGFMNLWNEPQQKILNMSTRIRLGEDQMKHYYDMLPPICEKLGIGVPELYLELDVVPNAYTSGDTHPFIVLTSGLLETLPDELIPTVLAHECGHIACHHVLYHTMGSFILSGTAAVAGRLLPMRGLLSVPLQIAFYYWMRCSEFSCDRAAVLCDGTAEKQQEVCMRLAGWGRGSMTEENMKAFLRQAENYLDMIGGSAWNKALEFMILQGRSHPLMALRATECGRWAETEEFSRILQNLPPAESGKTVPVPDEDSEFIQVCRIEGSENFICLPKNYEHVRSLPEDPPKSVTYVLNTEGARILVTVYPRDRKQIRDFDNAQAMIDDIHAALGEDQGLIEVDHGVTAKAGRKYIASIVKTVLKEDGVSRGVQYCLMMDIEYPDDVMTLKGFFEENGTPGSRDSAVFEFMRRENKVSLNDDGVTGWSCDPYDPSFTAGIPMNQAEHAAYDELFPLHPLSEARRFMRMVIEKN